MGRQGDLGGQTFGRGYRLASRLRFCRRHFGGFLGNHRDEIPFAQPQRQLDRFRQPRTNLCSHRQPIDHNLDVVPHLAVQAQIVAQPDHPAVNPGAGKTLLQQIDEQVAILAPLAADQRRQDEDRRARGQGQNAFDDLFAGLRGDGPAAL